jgi:hypothetical protein
MKFDESDKRELEKLLHHRDSEMLPNYDCCVSEPKFWQPNPLEARASVRTMLCDLIISISGMKAM